MGKLSDAMLGDDLFDDGRAFARTTDPATSHAAAASVESELPHMEQVVLDCLKSQGARGATWDEQAKITGMSPASISPRWKPLRKRGLITSKVDEYGEVIKRPGKSGRGQIVWFAK